MEMEFDVSLHDKKVGCVSVIHQGLYCKIDCTCTMKPTMIYRLLVRQGEDNLRLGIPVPEGNQLVLQTKVPAKKLDFTNVQFYLEPVKKEVHPVQYAGKFAPVYPDEPFRYLSRLKECYMEIRNGQPGIVLKD